MLLASGGQRPQTLANTLHAQDKPHPQSYPAPTACSAEVLQPVLEYEESQIEKTHKK